MTVGPAAQGRMKDTDMHGEASTAVDLQAHGHHKQSDRQKAGRREEREKVCA